MRPAQIFSFSVAAELVRVVISDLIRFGRTRRNYIGVAGADTRLPRRALNKLNLAEDRAVQVIGVETNSPAAKAGLREGDVVLSLRNKATTSSSFSCTAWRNDVILPDCTLSLVESEQDGWLHDRYAFYRFRERFLERRRR